LYNSRPLGILVSCIGVAFLLPYLQLQLTALGLIVEVASLGGISRITAMLIAFVMVAAFVFLSGLKGVASTALIKDIAMMLAMLFFGIYLPFHYFGGVGEMFAKIEAINPTYLIFSGKYKRVGCRLGHVYALCYGGRILYVASFYDEHVQR